jgi:hypothetical protein
MQGTHHSQLAKDNIPRPEILNQVQDDEEETFLHRMGDRKGTPLQHKHPHRMQKSDRDSHRLVTDDRAVWHYYWNVNANGYSNLNQKLILFRN